MKDKILTYITKLIDCLLNPKEVMGWPIAECTVGDYSVSPPLKGYLFKIAITKKGNKMKLFYVRKL